MNRPSRLASAVVLALLALAPPAAFAQPLERTSAPAHTQAQAPKLASTEAPRASFDLNAPSTVLRAEARAAAERRDWAEALARFEWLVRRHGDDVELLIESARVHGYADRNAEAAALYRRALALSPERRADLAPSLAWQSLWGGAPAQAEVLFAELADARTGRARVEALDGLAQALQAQGRQALALQVFREAHALAPGDLRLHRRYAMSLLWNGDEAGAIGELEALVARVPGDRDLAWALANARNFNGQHRAALRGFLAQAAPTHPGERADLARAWRWAGYEDRAWPLLADPTDVESAWLRDYRVRRELRPFGYATAEHAEDRDELVTDALVVGAGWHPDAGSTVELQARRLRMDDPHGRPRSTQFQAAYGWRLGESGGRHGTWWPTVAVRAAHFPGWSPVAASARLRWLPDDGWRVDAEAGREFVEVPRAVAHRVHVDVLSAGIERRPDPQWVLAGSLATLRFDDGSTRVRAGGRVERRIWARPHVAVGAEFNAFERTDGGGPVDRGYWNPQRYREGRIYAVMIHEIRPLDFRLRVGAGSARETDAWGQRSHGRPHLWELGVGLDLAPDVRLELSAGGSGQGMGLASGSSSGAGYWRRYASLTARVWF